MQILVTGGSGFIGSHTCIELLKSGFKIVIIDNLTNSNEESLKRVDLESLSKLFLEFKFNAVIHFAGFKSVAESVTYPFKYYYNNVIGTENLCRVMLDNEVKNIVFSSSATVYGNPDTIPIKEDNKTKPTNFIGIKYLVKLFL